jgi:hypothetical protein
VEREPGAIDARPGDESLVPRCQVATVRSGNADRPRCSDTYMDAACSYGEQDRRWRCWMRRSTHTVRHSFVSVSWAERNGLYAFHRDGQPLGVGAVRSAWKRASKRAGLVGRLVHDLRRSAARDFRRAGVGEVMKLCGWETRSMFDRYNIIDEADLAAAVAKRFNGKLTANSEGSADVVDSVTSSSIKL